MIERYGAHQGKGALAVVLAALLLAALIPVGVILAKDYLVGGSPPVSGPAGLPEVSSSKADPAAAKPKAEAASKSEPRPESKPEPPPPRFGLVKEGEAVSASYFDDAVFFGDSLTDGLGAYSTLSNATFIASTGVNPDSVFTKEAITLPGEEERCTMFSALGRSRPGKIYIMLGANWVGLNTGIEKKTFLNHYRTMLEKIREQQPEAIIYIQSMLPVSSEYEENVNGNNLVGLTNAIIRDYNEALLQLAEEMQLYYLDVHSAMADETGCLPGEETSDGMHLTPAYYTRWYDYLLTHTAPEADGKTGSSGGKENAPSSENAASAPGGNKEKEDGPSAAGSPQQSSAKEENPEDAEEELWGAAC